MTVPVRARAKEILVKRIPILGWLPNYTWGKLLQDALAGITVGLTAIPQGIAYAVVAGLPAQVINLFIKKLLSSSCAIIRIFYLFRKLPTVIV